MTKEPQKKTLSFVSDLDQEFRILTAAAKQTEDLQKQGIKAKIGLSDYVRQSIEEKLARDAAKSKKQKA